MELPFKEAEQIGRDALANGDLEQVRKWFTLSHTKLAGLLRTNSGTLKRWLSDPDFAKGIQDTTAARIGQFVMDLGVIYRMYLDRGVRVDELYPLAILAGRMGRSVNSPIFVELCRTKAITCYDMGVLGTYIPQDQVGTLKGKK